MSTHKPATQAYQNNPFMLAIEGLQLLFNKARSLTWVGIGLTVMFTILYVIYMMVALFIDINEKKGQATTASATTSQAMPPLETLLPFIIGGSVLFLVLGVILVFWQGIVDDTSAQLAAGKKTTFSESAARVTERFLPYLWLRILVLIKVMLWSLLFIIPGIIMAIRYSLAGVSFFDKKHSASAAIQHSAAMTKGSWLTTFAAQNLFNMVTGSVIAILVTPGANTLLYRQFARTTQDTRPPAHWLSWLTLCLPIAFYVFIFLIIAVVIIVAAANGTL